MVQIVINCNNQEKQSEVLNKLYHALVGSPAYINNEIILGEYPYPGKEEPDRENHIFLIVGNNNDGDIHFVINSDDFEIKEGAD